MTPHTVTRTFWDHATIWSSDDESMAGHSTDGGRVFGITRTRYAECDHYGCKPVAVIAYEDREQAERLLRSFYAECTADSDTNAMQTALREFANPVVKPDEPTGLGAVVEDARGRKWTRADDTDCVTPWHRNGSYDDSEWSDIAAVRVLSEGVTQ